MDPVLIPKIIENMGLAGLIIIAVWKLADRWAAKFLEVQDKQAAAMADLAESLKGSADERRELLLASRVMASKIDEMRGWLKEIGELCVQASCRSTEGRRS